MGFSNDLSVYIIIDDKTIDVFIVLCFEMSGCGTFLLLEPMKELKSVQSALEWLNEAILPTKQ
jgi:hypothetical protein